VTLDSCLWICCAGQPGHEGDVTGGGGRARGSLRDMLSMGREPSGGSPPSEAPVAESRTSKFAAGLRARLGSSDGGGGAGGGRLNSLRTRIMRGDLQTHTTDTAENSPVAPRLVRQFPAGLAPYLAS